MAILVKRHVALTFVVLALSVAAQVGSGAFQAPGPLLHETVVSSRDARRLKHKWRFQAVSVWGKVCNHGVISRTTALVTWMLHSLPSVLTGFSLSPIDAVPQQTCHYNSFLLSCAPDLVSPGSELSASASCDLDFEVQFADKQWTDNTDLEKQTKLRTGAFQQHERPCTELNLCRGWPGPAESCSVETARRNPTAVERDPADSLPADRLCSTVPSHEMHDIVTAQLDGRAVPASRMSNPFLDAETSEFFSLLDSDDDDQIWTACRIAEYEQLYFPSLIHQNLGAGPRECETFLTFWASSPGGCGAFLSHVRSAFSFASSSGGASMLQAERDSEWAFNSALQIDRAKVLQLVPEGSDNRSAVSVGTEFMGTPGHCLLPIPSISNDIPPSDSYVKQGDALQTCYTHSTCAACAHTSHTMPHACAEVGVTVTTRRLLSLIIEFSWLSACIFTCGTSIAAMLCVVIEVAAEPSEPTVEANPPKVVQLILARPALITAFTACLLGIAMLAAVCHMFPGTTNALRVPPAWGPEQENHYPFRQWTRDVMLWSIASDMEPSRKTASVMLVLKGAAKELSRQIPPQAIVDGGLINGVQVDPLTYLMHALQERFGNLGEEVRVQAITELMGFNRKGNEPIDALLVRFDSIRARAAEQGGAIVSVQGVTWILLRAIGISDQQLIHLLTPFNGQFPATEMELTQLKTGLRRMGHILERAPGNLREGLRQTHSNPSSAFLTHDDHWEPSHEQWGAPTALPEEWPGQHAFPASHATPTEAFALFEDDDVDTDSNTSSGEVSSIPEDGQDPNRVAQNLFWAYKQAKHKWRKYMGKTTRAVRRYAKRFDRRKGKGKGKLSHSAFAVGKGKGKKGKHPISAMLAEMPDEAVYQALPAFRGNRTSGKGKGRRTNPSGPDGQKLRCYECGSIEHLAGSCPRRQTMSSAGPGATTFFAQSSSSSGPLSGPLAGIFSDFDVANAFHANPSQSVTFATHAESSQAEPFTYHAFMTGNFPPDQTDPFSQHDPWSSASSQSWSIPTSASQNFNPPASEPAPAQNQRHPGYNPLNILRFPFGHLGGRSASSEPAPAGFQQNVPQSDGNHGIPSSTAHQANTQVPPPASSSTATAQPPQSAQPSMRWASAAVYARRASTKPSRRLPLCPAASCASETAVAKCQTSQPTKCSIKIAAGPATPTSAQ